MLHLLRVFPQWLSNSIVESRWCNGTRGCKALSDTILHFYVILLCSISCSCWECCELTAAHMKSSSYSLKSLYFSAMSLLLTMASSCMHNHHHSMKQCSNWKAQNSLMVAYDCM